MGQTMKNRGGGMLSFLFGKRMTSGEKRQRSAELRERRLANIPGTPQNVKKQQTRRQLREVSSPETRKRRRSTLPGTAENIARIRAKTRNSVTRSNSH